MELALMIEGQNGLNWPIWQRIAKLAEDTGFGGLFRSDHFTNGAEPDKDSLELWVSLTWLASHTSRIEFGPLVTPMSFRHPVWTARHAAHVDDLSGGRLLLGVGAGWQAREHTNFGFDLLDTASRFERFEEGLDVITLLLESDEPVSYAGGNFRLSDAVILPRPQRKSGPPILVGGNGERRTLPLAAKYASEWNALFINAENFKHKNELLTGHAEALGRDAGEIKRSLMTSLWYGSPDYLEAEAKRRDRTLDQIRERGAIVGSSAAEIVDQLGVLSNAGVERIMLQWLPFDRLDDLETLANDLVPQMAA